MAMPLNGQPQWWLQILSLSVLCWQLTRCAEQLTSWSSSTWSVDERRPDWQTGWKGAAWLGWIFATAWLASTFWWLFVSMHTYGGLPARAGGAGRAGSGRRAGALLRGRVRLVFQAVLCPCGMPGCPGLPCLCCTVDAGGTGAGRLVHRLSLGGRRLRPYRRAAGGLRALAGGLRRRCSRGVGRIHAGRTSGGIRPQPLGHRPVAGLVFALGLAAQWFGPAFTRSAGTQSVALLQGNIPQNEKFQPGTGVADALRWYGEQLQANQASLVVAPETAIPMLPQQLPDGYWAALQARFADGRQAALIGVPLGATPRTTPTPWSGSSPASPSPIGTTNTTWCRLASSFRRFSSGSLAMMNIPLGDFNRGTLAPPSFEWQGQRLAPNICYEDLFGEELGGGSSMRPRRRPSWSISATSAGSATRWPSTSTCRSPACGRWSFSGPCCAPPTPALRSIIDHRGQVTHSLPRHTRGVLEGVVEGRSGSTPFAMVGLAAGAVAGVVSVAPCRGLGRDRGAVASPLTFVRAAGLQRTAPAQRPAP